MITMQQLSNKPDKQTALRNVVIILVAVWVGLLFYNLLSQFSGMLTIHNYQPDFWSRMHVMTLKIWLPWVVLSPLVFLLARRFPVRPENWVRLAVIHMLLLLALSLLAVSVLSFHYHFREEMNEVMKTYQPWQHIGHFLFGDSLFLYNAIIYTVFIASFNIRNFHQLAQQRELDSVRLNSQLQEAQLHALKMQINPHFLFNTLNVISVLVIKQETEKATEMIDRLGNFFRATLEETNAQWVPLAEELQTVGQYLAIEQVRFGDRLKITESYLPEALSMQVPAMILQPLIENAMQHGIAEQEGECELRIETSVQAQRLVVSIQDNGAGCRFHDDPAFIEGIGIKNVRSRLQQIFGDDFVFKLTGAVGRGAHVYIELPAITDTRKKRWIRP